MSFPIEKVRKDFPILEEKVNGKPLIYLDNAATTQKPRQMIEALTNYYSSTNSNVHRGVHHLSQKATDAFEAGRQTVQDFNFWEIQPYDHSYPRHRRNRGHHQRLDTIPWAVGHIKEAHNRSRTRTLSPAH